MNSCHASRALLYGAGLLLAGGPAQAAPPAATPQRLAGIVVTATRTPRPGTDELAPTTVITRAQIEQSQARSVDDLLRRAPGVNIANQGGPAQLTSIFMRGTNADHVLVLVDGVRYGDATSGLAAIQDLPVSDIKRIEIVRGPRSSLYGSDAIGGVIQIFTRDGKGKGSHGPTPYFSLGAGSYETYKGDAGLSYAGKRGHYDLNVSGANSQGFNACSGRPSGAPGGGAGCFADQPDHDGYSRVSSSLRAGYRFANGVKLDGHYLRSNGHNQYDGTVSNRSATVQEVYGVTAADRLLKPWKAKLTLGHSRDLSRNKLNKAFASRFETMRDSIGLQNDVSLNPNNLLTFGVDYRREHVSGSTAYDKTSRHNTGIFAQYQGYRGHQELELAGRGDDNAQFGQHATGSIAWGWRFNDTYKFTVSYGTAFKAPTFNDLYYPGYSNPNLSPEKSRTTDVGFIAHPAWGHWSIHAYQTRIRDLIVLDNTYTPQNIGRARQRGVETDIGAYLGPWQISANATWLDAQNRASGPNHGNQLPRRPRYTANFDLDRRFGRFSAGTDVSVVSSRYDDAANTRRLSAYALVGLRGAVHLNADWQIQARLSNLLNRHYHTVAFYNQPGRSLFVTLRYQP